MNTVKREFSIRRYVMYVSLIVLVLNGLTLLLSTCAEEVIINPGKNQPGQKIAVQFSLAEMKHSEDEVSVREAMDANPETLTVPVGDDLRMVATVVADRSALVRMPAAAGLPNGALLRIVAYEDGTTYHAHADYRIVEHVLTSDSPLHVSAGDYRFVAYSYSSPTVLPAHHDYTLSNIVPSNHLLWGCYPENGTYRVKASTCGELPIMLAHQFSRVTVQATTEDIGDAYLIAGIGTVSIPGKKVNLTIKDGRLTAGSDITQHFSSAWTGVGTTMVISEPRLVYTHSADIFQVNIDSLNLHGYPAPFTNLTATFNKKLQGGVSYTIKVYFKRHNVKNK